MADATVAFDLSEAALDELERQADTALGTPDDAPPAPQKPARRRRTETLLPQATPNFRELMEGGARASGSPSLSDIEAEEKTEMLTMTPELMAQLTGRREPRPTVSTPGQSAFTPGPSAPATEPPSTSLRRLSRESMPILNPGDPAPPPMVRDLLDTEAATVAVIPPSEAELLQAQSEAFPAPASSPVLEAPRETLSGLSQQLPSFPELPPSPEALVRVLGPAPSTKLDSVKYVFRVQKLKSAIRAAERTMDARAGVLDSEISRLELEAGRRAYSEGGQKDPVIVQQFAQVAAVEREIARLRTHLEHAEAVFERDNQTLIDAMNEATARQEDAVARLGKIDSSIAAAQSHLQEVTALAAQDPADAEIQSRASASQQELHALRAARGEQQAAVNQAQGERVSLDQQVRGARKVLEADTQSTLEAIRTKEAEVGALHEKLAGPLRDLGRRDLQLGRSDHASEHYRRLQARRRRDEGVTEQTQNVLRLVDPIGHKQGKTILGIGAAAVVGLAILGGVLAAIFG